MSKGLLISIEGPDGAGKTSVLKVLLPLLREVYPAQVITSRICSAIATPPGSRVVTGSKPAIGMVRSIKIEKGVFRNLCFLLSLIVHLS